MSDFFTSHSKFVELDHRKDRPNETYKITAQGNISFSYPISVDFMERKHLLMLPPDLVKNKTVLDIGSCLGATGGWALHHGATHYTGLEVQQTYIDKSKLILSEYYDDSRFEIVNCAIEQFDASSQFDIVVASGVLYAVFDSFALIEKLSRLAKEMIIIETKHPYAGFRHLWSNISDDRRKELSKKVKLIQMYDDNHMVDADSDSFYSITSSKVSIASLSIMFRNHGWSHDPLLYDLAEKEISEVYDILNHDRYMARFVPDNSSITHFYKEIHNPNARKISWTGNLIRQ